MTDREKAIIMAYTGICMLTGDKLSVFYEYVESIMGRPIYTHEMAIKAVDDEIKEKARPDFIALCADESSSEKPNKSEIPTGWIPVSEIEDIKAEINELSELDHIEPTYEDCKRDVLEIINKRTSGAKMEGEE